MPTLAELQAQLQALPALIVQELADDADKTSEYLWLARVVEHLLPWAGDLGLRFERFQRTVSVTDTRSVKPAQMARSLGSFQRLLEQLARNPLLSDTERQMRLTLAEVLGQLEHCFSRGGVVMVQPSAPQPKPRSAHDTGMISLLYGLDTLKTAPEPPAAPPPALEPAEPEPVPEPPRRLSAQEKMLQAMARALRQRQHTSDKDKS